MSSAKPQVQLPRYHSIDSLRAVTMLLVLVFHAAIIYLPFDTDRVLYQDEMRSPFTGWVVLFTRLFHMPVFFMVSGFFAAFLYDTRGAMAFLHHRLKRIGLPLVYSFLVLYPLMAAGDLYTKYLTGDAPLDVERELWSFVQTLGIDLWHLWFLYQLLILCVAAAAIMPLIRFVPESTRDRLLDLFKGTVDRWWGVALWAAIGFLTLYFPSGIFLFDIDTSLLPPYWMLVGNGVFVALGWLVYKRREVLEGFKSHAWGYFIAGFIGHGVYLYLGFLKGSTQVVMLILETLGLQVGADAIDRNAQILTTACLALAVYLLVFGLFGIFLRYFESENAYWRYIADASFWIYLAHVPVIVILAPLLSFWALPALLKFCLLSAATTAITTIIYHYCVRATFIGEMLNGRRYPRVAPWRG